MSFRTCTDRPSYLALCLLLCGLATLAGAQQPQKKAGGKKAGVKKYETRTYDFKEAKKDKMEYTLYVPTKYDKSMKSPLMLALHGLGGNPQQMINSKGLIDNAEKYGYLVAAPMGYNSSGWYGAQGPGGGKGIGFGKGKGKGKGKGEAVPKNLGELSEQDVLNVLAEVRKEFNVDEKRIYLIGHSMGGAGTYHLGSKYPEIWAGLGPIAAASGVPKNAEKLKGIPIIIIHGDQDTAVPVANARKVTAKLKELDIDHEYVEFKGGDHGSVIGQGMPKIFEFFEKNAKAVKSGPGQQIKILDGSPRLLVVNGYSTSFQWPDVLQRKLNKLFDGKNPVKVEKATVAGSPIAKWMNVKTGEPLSPWNKVLRPKLQKSDQTPVIVLCQQSLQGVYGGQSAGIRGPDDTERIGQGADLLEKYTSLLLKDGADLVFVAMHIYKHPMEPAIGNERLALTEFMKRKPANVVEGPDVWTPTKEVHPFGFAADGMHPAGCGVEVMAHYWFEALAKYDGREVPAWSKEDMNRAIQQDKAKRGK